MGQPPCAGRARLVLQVAGPAEVCVGIIDRTEPCDAALVDRVLKLRLRAARAGVVLLLRDVDPELAALLDLFGVRELLER